MASFREGLPSASRSSRRGLGRRIPLLLFAATICFALTVLLRRSNTKEAAAGAADLEAADQRLLKVLVKTKEAIQQETPLEDIAAFADRAKVLMVRRRVEVMPRRPC